MPQLTVDVGRYDPSLDAAIAPGRRLMSRQIDAAALNQLFLAASTHNKWQPKDVPGPRPGPDTGPLSGFDNAVSIRSSSPGLISDRTSCAASGYGEPAGVLPRSPRLSFDEMAKIILGWTF
jgi:hypothetical protein